MSFDKLDVTIAMRLGPRFLLRGAAGGMVSV